MRKAVVFGGVLLVLGHCGLAFEGDAATRAVGIVARDEDALWTMYLSLALIVVGVGFLKRGSSARAARHQRQRMLALMALIFMALVFFTLYEQTYGSWVTFTDRMLTKEIVPALVVRGGTPLP